MTEMGDRQNGPLGLYLHLDDRFAPGFPQAGLPLRLVLPGPIGTSHWLAAAAVNRSRGDVHRHALNRSTRLEKFKKDVIALQVYKREHANPPKIAVLKLDESELGDIPDKQKMRRDLAILFLKMWAEASKDHKARPDGIGTDSIGVASGYRSAIQDARAWERAFPKYFHATSKDRLATGDEFGRRSVQIFVHHMNGKKAPPGFSGHTQGIAVDLTTREKGNVWTVNSNYEHQVGWQKTWLYMWLVGNAWKHKFYQLKTETWHWEYHEDVPPTQCWGGKVTHRPVPQPA